MNLARSGAIMTRGDDARRVPLPAALVVALLVLHSACGAEGAKRKRRSTDVDELDDEQLADACARRAGCAAKLATVPAETCVAREEGSSSADVHGMDTLVRGSGWRMLFGTPLRSVDLGLDPAVNEALADLVRAERDGSLRRASGGARSIRGGTAYRTDDRFLSRPEPAVRTLLARLRQEVEVAVQFGQPRRLRTDLHLIGWGVALGPGDGQEAHVHSMAVWSGVYYVKVPHAIAARAAGDARGCLQLADPRPAASMITLGQNDMQFGNGRTICPTSGQLLLFPAWLSHSVPHIEARQSSAPGAGGADWERIAVAFNVHGAEAVAA